MRLDGEMGEFGSSVIREFKRPDPVRRRIQRRPARAADDPRDKRLAGAHPLGVAALRPSESSEMPSKHCTEGHTKSQSSDRERDP